LPLAVVPKPAQPVQGHDGDWVCFAGKLRGAVAGLRCVGADFGRKKAQYAAGRHEEVFDLESASGVMWYELTTPFGVLTKKMVAGTK
jgi:hypothetical protein